MGRPQRKRDEDDDEEDDDDEEEDDADFDPEGDPDDDDEDDDDGADDAELDESVPIWDGKLLMDEEKRIIYHGTDFHLSSQDAVPWNLLGSSTTHHHHLPSSTSSLPMLPPENTYSCVMAGQVEGVARKMRVTWSVQDPPTAATMDYFTTVPRPAQGRKRHRDNGDQDHQDEEDDHHQKPAALTKNSNLFYWVAGQEVVSASEGGDHSGGAGNSPTCLEFQGGYYPHTNSSQEKGETSSASHDHAESHREVSLVCRVRHVTVARPAAAKSPPAAAARSTAGRNERNADDEDDEEEDEADEDVDFDELVALRKEAGISVDTLRQRYRRSTRAASGVATASTTELTSSALATEHGFDEKEEDEEREEAEDDYDTKEENASKNQKKRAKGEPKDDDDDDYGF